MESLSAAQQLRRHLSRHELWIAPGVFDGLSARIAEQAGAHVVYASGGAIARSVGVPDLGLLSMTEMRDRVAQICAAVRVPVIADADTGHGNALNVVRTVREFARTGVAAIHLEDQVTPKRCGHYAGKTLIDVEEMCGKIEAALDARPDHDLVVIARTDAIAVTGFADALRRAERYVEVGADVVFMEAPESREQVIEIAHALCSTPLLINMFSGGRTPLMEADELEQLGYRIMIVPSDLQRAAQRAMAHATEVLLREGSCRSILNEIGSFTERDEIVEKEVWDNLALRYTSSKKA